MYSLKRRIVHAAKPAASLGKSAQAVGSFDCLCLNGDAFTDACEQSSAECGRINDRTDSRSGKMRPETASFRVAGGGNETCKIVIIFFPKLCSLVFACFSRVPDLQQVRLWPGGLLPEQHRGELHHQHQRLRFYETM